MNNPAESKDKQLSSLRVLLHYPLLENYESPFTPNSPAIGRIGSMMHPRSRTAPALPDTQRQTLARAIRENDDVTVFVDGTAVKLPTQARDAVVDLLQRLAAGDSVTVASVAETLTTSQAAEAAGISHTYLRNLTDAGVIPVEYRGTHRRIRRDAIDAWLATQRKSDAGTP